MEDFNLEGSPFIKLCDLLKTMGLVENGGMAKSEIADGQVKVNGETELRKRYKVVAGDEIFYADTTLKIRA